MMEEPQLNDLRETPFRGIQRILSQPKSLGTRTIRWWQTLNPQHKKLLLGLGVSMVLIVVILAVWKIPQRQLEPLKAKIQRERNSLQPQDRLKLEHDARKLENDARTTLIQAVGGLALLIGLYFTAKTWHTTQEGQVTDRFTKAINHLGETGPEKLAIRLGGIYALERIARDSERDHWPIMEILTNYIIERAPWPPKGDQLPEGGQEVESNSLRAKLAIDIQAVLTVLGRRNRTFEQEDQSLNLQRTDLRGADLQHLHLERANLSEAHLERAIFGQVHLEKALLIEAHLEGALLIGTHLEGAALIGANLKGCWFPTAYLKGADFLDADLDGADFRVAHLNGSRNLTIEQLASVETLYDADLDLPLLEQIRQQYPHLLEKPRD
jgi:Pentapeptide repeats (8 copies)